MKSLLILPAITFAAISATFAAESTVSLAELRTNGVFGFPQSQARVLCDQATLRLSVWNNDEHLFAQAVLWTDDDPAVGKTDDNREIGDSSSLSLDLDANGKSTAELDRSYSLNPWPHMPGLHYSVCMGEGSTTPLQAGSQGRGAIRFVKTTSGPLVRVDTFLIPMEEIARHPGDVIQLSYWGSSPKPELIVNSSGYQREGTKGYAHAIPLASYQRYVLTNSHEIDSSQVPEGRKDISLSNRKNIPAPKVGTMAPEISAGEWINLPQAPTLVGLRGQVVVLEFWATWCGPCVAGIPHLNELQKKHAGKNFQLLSFVEEGHKTMDRFLARNKVAYPIGLESTALENYGITGIPHAYVIGANGMIAWHGHTGSPDFDQAIAAALKKSAAGD